MKILSTSRNKIILLLLISILIFAGWKSGIEVVYARALVATTNVCLKMAKKDTHLAFEKTATYYEFKIDTQSDGRNFSYPLETGSWMQPFVIVLSWQIFLFFVLKRRLAFRSLGVNVGIFLLLQTIFMIFMTGYFSSTTQLVFCYILFDIFSVVAVILVIKDYLLYPVFTKKVVSCRL